MPIFEDRFIAVGGAGTRYWHLGDQGSPVLAHCTGRCRPWPCNTTVLEFWRTLDAAPA